MVNKLIMLINGNLRTNIVPLGTMTMGRFGINQGEKEKKGSQTSPNVP